MICYMYFADIGIMCMEKGQSAGFSLIELVIVVMIIGVLGAIALPRLSRAATSADHTAVAETLLRPGEAFTLYYAKNGSWPKDVTPGLVPAEMADYLHERDMDGSPLGGRYDWQEWESIGHGPGGVHVSIINVKDWSAAKEVDKLIDDGNLKTGSVIKHSQYLLYTLEK